MFKNLTIFRCKPFDLAAADLEPARFMPCGPTEPARVGLVPVRGKDHSPLVEFIGGVAVMRARIEQRILPPAVLREALEKACQQVERESGRKPGAKRRRELKDELLLEMLPKAFTRSSDAWLMMPDATTILVDQVSDRALDPILTLLARCVPDLSMSLVNTETAPGAAMLAWLLDGVAPAGFGIGREAILCSTDSTGASVRYSKHSLDGEDVAQHLKSGKQVKSLALNHKDRVDFVLDERLRLRKVKLDEAVFVDAEASDGVDPFDGNVVMTAGALVPLLGDLLGALVEVAPQ